MGSRIQQLHEENGVQFRLNQKATGFEGHGSVEAVVTDGGESVPADLVIVGVGIDPATEICDGMKLHPADGSIVVDAYLQAVEGVFAAGDVARFPNAHSDKDVRIEHWRLAAQHGRIAAHNMLGRRVPFKGGALFLDQAIFHELTLCRPRPRVGMTSLFREICRIWSSWLFM